MNAVFSDTSAWLASLDPRQAQHAEAREERRGLAGGGAAFMTTNLVLAEMHAMLTRDRGPLAGLRLLDDVRTDPQYTVLHVDREIESAAVDRWLRVFSKQPFSLCDAVSFEVMRREGLRQAFTLDHHFAVAGFTMLPAPQRPKRRR